MKTFIKLILLMVIWTVVHIPSAFAVEPVVVPEVTSQQGQSTVNEVTSNAPKQEIPKLTNPVRVQSIEELLFAVVDMAIFLGVIFAVFIFIFVGFKFVMAQGDPRAIKEAKQWFLYAVIGTALLIGSRLLVDVIKNTVTKAGLVNESLFRTK